MHLSTRRWPTLMIVAIAVGACSAAATPGADEAAGVLRAYETKAANPARSFHMLQTGTVSAGGQTQEIRYELDASGDDLSGMLKVAGQALEMRLVDGAFFANAGDGWQALGADADVARDILDFFRYVGDPANLRFVERVQESTTAVFRFRAVNPVPYQTAEMRARGLTGSIPEVDFFVREDGVPVRITFRSTAEQGNTTIEARSTVEFSRWGEAITITAPR